MAACLTRLVSRAPPLAHKALERLAACSLLACMRMEARPCPHFFLYPPSRHFSLTLAPDNKRMLQVVTEGEVKESEAGWGW
jgi:hypothetical protein